jgi:hypothetical protein
LSEQLAQRIDPRRREPCRPNWVGDPGGASVTPKTAVFECHWYVSDESPTDGFGKWTERRAGALEKSPISRQTLAKQTGAFARYADPVALLRLLK